MLNGIVDIEYRYQSANGIKLIQIYKSQITLTEFEAHSLIVIIWLM